MHFRVLKTQVCVKTKQVFSDYSILKDFIVLFNDKLQTLLDSDDPNSLKSPPNDTIFKLQVYK